jgi:DNA polymerase
MKHYAEKLERLNIPNPTLRDCFDPYSSEYSETNINQKIATLQKVINSGYALEEVLKDYSDFYQKLNKRHVVKDLHLGLKRLINHFLEKHTLYRLKELDNYEKQDLIFVLTEFLKYPNDYNSKIKKVFYKHLVDKRKSYQYKTTDIINPSSIPNLEFDEHLNAWANWCGDLDAEILVIGQDFGNEKYYITYKGKDEIGNPTNLSLIELFKELGKELNDVNHSNEHLNFYFTNAVLGAKRNTTMAGQVKKEWYSDTALKFTKPLIEIINPKLIIAMGSTALDVVSIIYNLDKTTISAAVANNPIILPDKKKLFVVYHCSKLGQVNRKFEEQRNDWKKIAEHLE